MQVVGWHFVRVDVEPGVEHNYGVRPNGEVKMQHHRRDPYSLQQFLLFTSLCANHDLNRR